MRQKVVPRANREAIAGFIRPPLQLGLVKPGTDFRHEVLVMVLRAKFSAVKTVSESPTRASQGHAPGGRFALHEEDFQRNKG